ncbi:succinate dehydrogenase, cytochrome b556 subunit [Beggiatoa alba]|nr:succinate dehydrogenase, cytochrome b556 subunit [Beggiatoa alba]
MNTTDNRPVYLNLLKIRQPVTAVLSIFHRISGVIMVLVLPGFVYLLSLSLSDQAGFEQVSGWLTSLAVKSLAVFLGWALIHHMLAGIRFILLDFDLGIERAIARQTAWLVHVLAAIATLSLAGWLF